MKGILLSVYGQVLIQSVTVLIQYSYGTDTVSYSIDTVSYVHLAKEGASSTV